MAICWYCEKEITGFRYKIAGNECDIECANNQINRSLELLGRLLAEIPEFVGVGLGYDKPEFFWYIFAESELAVRMISEECSMAQLGFSLYPLMASIPSVQKAEPIVSMPGRVIMGGVSVGHFNLMTTGTLGGILRIGDQRYAVSTASILAPYGARLGDMIVQPSIEDSPNRTHSLGKLSVISKLAFGSINDLDAAIATINPEVRSSPRIMEIGSPTHVAEPEIGVRIRKTGRTTGFTEGEILCTDARIKVLKDGQQYILQDQFLAFSPREDFAKDGDEGSFILNNSNDLIGMIQLVFHGMAVCARGNILLDRFGFSSPFCFEQLEEEQ